MEQRQKAILVGVNLNNQPDFTSSMEELLNLADACDIEVVAQVTQNLKHFNRSHYIGKGKLKEVQALIAEKEGDLVIFNDELSPSQIRNLEAGLDCRVIDRTILILDIFAKRAKTKEAQLQVEVAQLQYMLPRLIGFGETLSRQTGGVGTKTRGAGEKKLELDRRRIEERISALRKELESIVSRRQNQRKQRKKKEIPVVSLVGYTNSGKSTIMNAMVELFNPASNKQVLEKDMLFATLETSVRNIQLPDNKSFLLTDTVGFVSKLPHHLIKAFRSTLEEAAEADLLIQVVDYSDLNYRQHEKVTDQTLKEMGIEGIPMIYAYNKVDLTDVAVPKINDQVVYLSAKQKKGVSELTEIVKEQIFKDYVNCQLFIPYDQGQIISYFSENAHVLDTIYEETGTRLVVECRGIDLKKHQNYVLDTKNGHDPN